MPQHTWLRDRATSLLSTGFVLCAAGGLGAAPLPADEPVSSQRGSVDSYASELQSWREANEKSLKAPGGWLALTAHAWLRNGANEFGPGSKNVVPLPDDAPVAANGNFQVIGDSVVLNADRAAEVYVNEKLVDGAVSLEISAEGEEADGRDKIRIGDRLTLQLVRRTGRLAVRVRDSQSPLIRAFSGKTWYAPDTAFRVEAKYVAFNAPQTIAVKNVRGDSVNTEFSGRVEFELGGKPRTLDVIEETPGKLFIIFKDKTNGVATYPSGRFLMADADSDGRVILDFNKAYNPPCAFSPHTLCPVPPAQNQLPIDVTAGETYSVNSK